MRPNGLQNVVTPWRGCVMDPSMPGFYSPTHISHVTGLFGVNRAKKVQKNDLRKYDVIITSWRSYVKIFFRSKTCLHNISIFPESLKAIGGKTSPREPMLEVTDFVAPTAKIGNVFELYNKGKLANLWDIVCAWEIFVLIRCLWCL